MREVLREIVCVCVCVFFWGGKILYKEGNQPNNNDFEMCGYKNSRLVIGRKQRFTSSVLSRSSWVAILLGCSVKHHQRQW